MSDVASSRRMMAAFVFIIYGPICWALQLALIYGSQSALCAFGADWRPVTTAVLVLSLATMALAGAGSVWPATVYRLLAGTEAPAGQWPFMRFVMRLLTGLALLAMLYAALGALLLPACAVLR